MSALPRIAVFSGPTATIGNSPPLVTSNKARAKHGLPLLTGDDGEPVRFDILRAQRLAAPVTVYVEAFSAHPLELDAAHLYAPPDGWVDASGAFSEAEPEAGGTPVFAVELGPDDGLIPLPYMARQADGSAWEDAVTQPFAPPETSRQTFYPDASRIYEEIDRLGVGGDGRAVQLSGTAAFDFYRPAPSGGYTRGLPASSRTDTAVPGISDGDVPAEVLGEDFFVYYPFHLHREPPLAALARATNVVQEVMATGEYIGAQWLEGSPTTEETMYWLGLLVDTDKPLVGHSAQRPHGSLSADGDRNIVDGVKYLVSGVALDAEGRDRIGPVMIVDEVVHAAREVTKVDARPGGYESVGGHGGVVADMGGYGPPQVTFIPDRRHGVTSSVRLSVLPSTVEGVAGSLTDGVQRVPVAVKDDAGRLLASAMPLVTMTKYGRYTAVATAGKVAPDSASEVEVLARIEANLAGAAPLAGFVAEGMSPYGLTDPTTNAALAVATFAGMPVVRVGRGNTGGMAYKLDPLAIAGNNLSATKARMLLMACLLRFGALPVAADPWHPTADEVAATKEAVAAYQEVFETH
ncbi:MAG: asparaginase domain-containing protein [Kineosporiaceae bacterium]